MKNRSTKLSFTIVSSLVTLLAAIPEVEALTIVRNFTGGNPPPRTVGEGNLVDIFNAAADLWEEAILDDHTLTIDYRWSPRSGNILATYSPINRQNTFPFRETFGIVRFDNDDRFSWFLDPTPYQNEEYLTFSETTRNFGAGDINTGRIYRNPVGDALGQFDLFTIALHEIGHGLNILSSNFAFGTDTRFDRDIDVEAPRPFPGSEIPTTPTGGGHIDNSSTVMYPFISPNQRKLLSEADIIASAEVSNFTNINLNPQQIPPQPRPEPNPNLLPNGSFETGSFANWQTIGDTSIETAAFGNQPTDGMFQALLSTGSEAVPTSSIEAFLGLDMGSLDALGNGEATSGSAIQQTFTANAGDILTFDWNFLTNENTPTIFNDFAFVSISSLSELADTTFPTFFSSLSPFDEETGYQPFSFTIPKSGTYSLGLGVTDVRDTAVNSGLLIDNVAVAQVPEPSSILSLLAFGWFGIGITLKSRK